MFHLGALTRLNELGLLAGTETICAVSGGSILGSLVATRVPWPLYGAFRDWPERVAEPLREICSRRARRGRLRTMSGGAAHAEHYARELAGWPEGEAPEWPRVVFGAAGLELGQMAGPEGEEPGLSVRWEMGRPRRTAGADPMAAAASAIRADLAPLAEGERALLENHGYCLVDAALRSGSKPPAALEPLPPLPPHPQWHNERHARELASRPRRRRLRRKANREGRGEQPAGEASDLLRRHRPFVQHDSLESYRPESVATIAELEIGSRCNTLHRANGELLASVLPLEGAARLDLDYLGAPSYTDGRPAREDDYLDEAGGSHAGDALAARDGRGHDEVVYGRAAASAGRLWLQYWLFYYYDDKGFLEVGRHEGDWETVQLRVNSGGAPDAVTYGRHSLGERADWGEVERQSTEEEEALVVYCARGSHALLPSAGTRMAPVVPDHNDGLGPRTRPRLVEIGGDPPGWVRWPGRWGSTRRREAFEGESPRGPAQHSNWRDPAAFHEQARPLAEAPRWEGLPPPTPRLEVRLKGNHASLAYAFGGATAGSAPGWIIATPIGEGGGAGGGIVHTFRVDGGGGACAVPVPADLRLSGIRACVVSEQGTPGPTLVVPLAA
jgi:hypothetical protein